jgi:dTDP-4-amino-4,6-dideoxygalactose transaminase
MTPQKRNIPIIDLKKQYLAIKHMVDERVLSVLSSGNYIMGSEVAAFEKEFAFLLQSPNAVGVNSGTDALFLALKALGIGEGDEVITTPCSFIATVEAIIRCGAKPVFADVRASDSNIDPKQIERNITKKTKAILPVHLYGFVCDMKSINAIAKKHKLRVIEDCAQAIGAYHENVRVGTLSDAGCFSFYPTKNLAACGDAGAVVTPHTAVHEKLKVLRTHGSALRGSYEHLGINSRLDEIQAAVLRVKLLYVDRWNALRRKLGVHYDSLFSNHPRIEFFKPEVNTRAVYYLYCILVEKRELIQERLARKGISTIVHYPIPLHEVEALKYLGYKKGDFPVAENLSKKILAIPLYPELLFQDQEEVAEGILEILK